MLNKDQMFIVHEFVTKNADKNVWNVTSELINMALELINSNKKESNNNIIGPNKEIRGQI